MRFCDRGEARDRGAVITPDEYTMRHTIVALSTPPNCKTAQERRGCLGTLASNRVLKCQTFKAEPTNTGRRASSAVLHRFGLLLHGLSAGLGLPHAHVAIDFYL